MHIHEIVRPACPSVYRGYDVLRHDDQQLKTVLTWTVNLGHPGVHGPQTGKWNHIWPGCHKPHKTQENPYSV